VPESFKKNIGFHNFIYFMLHFNIHRLYRKFEAYIPRNENVQPLFSNIYIHVSGSDLFIRSYFGISIFLYCLREPLAQGENSWLNHRRGGEGRELPPSSGWRQLPALPSSPAVETSHK
jgi:hypothetical protein